MRILFLMLVLVAAYPSTVPAARAQSQPLTLNSGRIIVPLVSGPLISTKGWSAQALEYQTSLSSKDTVALRFEADELWSRFIHDTIRAGRDQAILMARTQESATTPSPSGTTNFVYKKVGQMWRASEWSDASQAKLDDAFVRNFMARLNHIYRHRASNAFLLYFAEDWSIDTEDKNGKSSAKLADMVPFWRDVLPTLSEVQVILDITNVNIAPDGRSAVVESRATETHVFKHRRFETISRGINYISVKDDYALITKSGAVAESQTESTLN